MVSVSVGFFFQTKVWDYCVHLFKEESYENILRPLLSIFLARSDGEVDRKSEWTLHATWHAMIHWVQSSTFIIHQTHYERSDWSRAFNQFTIACELDMINVISAADITFIMSSSTSAWLLSPLECSPQKQNGWTFQLMFITLFR